MAEVKVALGILKCQLCLYIELDLEALQYLPLFLCFFPTGNLSKDMSINVKPIKEIFEIKYCFTVASLLHLNFKEISVG